MRDGAGVTTVAVAEGAVQVTARADGRVRACFRRGESIMLAHSRRARRPPREPPRAGEHGGPPGAHPDIRSRIRQGACRRDAR